MNNQSNKRKAEEYMCTLINVKIRVKCIKENKYGFVIGKVYDAYTVKSPMKNNESIIAVINDFGEEYAYPIELFEMVDT